MTLAKSSDIKNSLSYINHWNKSHYVKAKIRLFEVIDAYVGRAPQRILDIGCGFAQTSEMFQKKYGSELWLLEGDKSATANATRFGKWGQVDNFGWYLPVDVLKETWDSRGMKYTHIDGSRLKIKNHIKFDLVYSWLSCGFHYPLDTYRDFVKKHTTEDSIIIMDIRNVKAINWASLGIDVINIVEKNNKKQTVHFRYR